VCIYLALGMAGGLLHPEGVMMQIAPCKGARAPKYYVVRGKDPVVGSIHISRFSLGCRYGGDFPLRLLMEKKTHHPWMDVARDPLLRNLG